ncbi:hypothetical protein BXZ70DRAFT_1010799 [Cristinia sonorae]|uniref:Uncharacterized protein n=1 Tax=Cristinia sonorae TaxID=1940300 RepID=A0A8K0UHN8_9AGAR|nr:hypothetical protein BXZ70DRAFT_1010799 [Cristinia sonorae]
MSTAHPSAPPLKDSGNAQGSPLLGSVANQPPPYLATPPVPKSSKADFRSTVCSRKFLIRAGQVLLLGSLILYVISAMFCGVTGGGIDYQADAVQEARWTNHDEELPSDESHRNPDDFRHLLKTSFDLPLDSDRLYFVSRGALSHGNIQFVDDGKKRDKVVVDIDFWYVSDAAKNAVQTSRLQRDHGKQNGIGIFSPSSIPRGHYEEYRTEFAVTVHLPSGGNHLYNEVQTDMPLFSHNISDLEGGILFKTLNLKTENSAIHIKSVVAGTAYLTTSNGRIEGKITATESLDIDTSNAGIKTEIVLHNGDANKTSKLNLRTSNGPIVSSISLVSDTKDKTGGSFTVNADTSNSHIDISYPTAPVDSILNFTAHNSNAPVTTKLHETFQGKLDLSTDRYSSATLVTKSGVEDPAGRGRKRSIRLIHYSKGSTKAAVSWGDEKPENEVGSVNLSTTASNVKLTL